MMDLIKAIAQFGIVPVLLGVLIWLLVNFITKQQKDKDFLIRLIKEGTTKEHTKQEETENKVINHGVDYQLEILIDEVKANRVSFFEYHNGGYGVTGRSFQKMSVMNEKIDGQTIPLMNSYQNLPRRMYPVVTDQLFQKGEFYLDDVDSIKETDTLSYHWWSVRGAKTVYIKSVIDNVKGVTLGFIAVEFMQPLLENADGVKLSISKAAQRVGGILQASKK